MANPKPGLMESIEAEQTSSFGGDAPMARVNFQLPAEHHMKLKVYAAQHGTTITELLTEHVERLLSPPGRTVNQIAAAATGSSAGSLFVLCADGSMWERSPLTGNAWKALPAIPNHD